MNIGKAFLKEDDFTILWSSIENELYKLFYNNKCSALAVYNNVYIICTDPGNKFIENLYWKLGDFIYDRARDIRTVIYRAEDWIVEYNKGWKRFKEYIGILNDLCEFINQYLAAKSLDEFAFILWERCILQTTKKYKGTTLGWYLATECKIEYIRDALDSLKCVVVDSRDPLVYYTQRYEQYALEKIKTRYEREVKHHDFKEDIIVYSTYVYKTVEKERENSKRILLEESTGKLEMILQDILITQRKKHIQTEVYKILTRHKLPVEVLDTIRDSGCGTKREEAFTSQAVTPIKDFYALYYKKAAGKTQPFSSEALEQISILFGNFSSIPHSYEIMRGVLLKYMSSQLGAHAHLFDRRVESLYLFYSMFKNIIEMGFSDDPGCIEVLKFKFSQVYNSLRPSLSSRLIEFSTAIASNDQLVFGPFEDKRMASKIPDRSLLLPHDIYTDRPFFTNPMDPSPNYKEAALFEVFHHLFALVEDKFDFSERYAYELGKRLVKGTTDIKKECHLIQIIKKGFIKKGNGCDSIRKSEVMLTDINKYLNTLYSGDQSNPPLLLTACAWPLEHVNLNVKIPPLFSKFIEKEEKKNKKRKLYWLWEHSTVHLEINDRAVRVNLLQFIVLDLFNSQPSLSKEDISTKTKLKGKTLEWVLSSLIRSDLLMEVESKISLSTRPHKHNPYDYYIKENLLGDHEVNRPIYYQSIVSKIMKHHKEMKKMTLTSKVLTAHTDRFNYDKEEYKKALESLVEKGVIEEEKGLLKYIP